MSELQKYYIQNFSTQPMRHLSITHRDCASDFAIYLPSDVDAARAADQQQISTLMAANAEYCKRHVEQLEQIRLLSERLARSEAALRRLRDWAMVTDRGRYIHRPPVALIDTADLVLGDHAPVFDVKDLAAADGKQQESADGNR